MQIPTRQVHGKEARKKMMEGINEIADTVGSTMGAKGRNVIYESTIWKHKPVVVNDGVTIAREIFYKDPLKNLGTQLVKGAAIRTNDKAGDGTTGSLVLAREIAREGWKCVEEGANPVLLRRSVNEAADAVRKRLIELSLKISSKEQAVQVASIAVQDKGVGKKIGAAMYDIGAEGAVTIIDGMKEGVHVEKADGMRIKSGHEAGVVTNPEKMEAKFQNVRVLVMNDPVDDHEFESKWIPFARQLVSVDAENKIKKVHVPILLIVTEKLSLKVVQFMNQNKEIVKWLWVKPPSFGEKQKAVLQDICAVVGTKLIDKEEGTYLDRFSIEDLGHVEAISADRKQCTIAVKDHSDVFLDRCNELKGQIEAAEDEHTQKELKERYAALTGGVATVKVAAATEQDTNELKLRIEDAVNATRSAMEEGIVPGGGIALLRAMEALSTFDTPGAKVMRKACEAPLRQILANAGYEEEKIDNAVTQLKEHSDNTGINVLTEDLVDMVVEGIVDPLKVIRHALANAVSVSGLLLTSQYSITCEDDKLEDLKGILK